MTEEHGELSVMEYDPPSHVCPTHGQHPRWIALYGYGTQLPAYCMDCIRTLLEREHIGRVMVDETAEHT